eukprot:TRINITY_DN35778_c0_g1_i1.p1 TRINITY_DN35778_c0_g1~~TRINITY_DN35778_c0_g1_i1.p1  ORF type:complete len:383 (+),score=63.10 TRINITY_DN35778_c0_g1_i1:101-1249(+)
MARLPARVRGIDVEPSAVACAKHADSHGDREAQARESPLPAASSPHHLMQRPRAASCEVVFGSTISKATVESQPTFTSSSSRPLSKVSSLRPCHVYRVSAIRPHAVRARAYKELATEHAGDGDVTFQESSSTDALLSKQHVHHVVAPPKETSDAAPAMAEAGTDVRAPVLPAGLEGTEASQKGSLPGGDAYSNAAQPPGAIEQEDTSHRQEYLRQDTVVEEDGLTAGEQLQLRHQALSKDFELVLEQKRLLQDELAGERARSEKLSQQLTELMQVTQERMRTQERLTCVETSELRSQVEALLVIKRQLFQRTQDLEVERNVLRTERDAAMSDRACVVCLDRVASTVLLRCRHLVCCEKCASKVRDCPVCRQPVQSRLTIFSV